MIMAICGCVRLLDLVGQVLNLSHFLIYRSHSIENRYKHVRSFTFRWLVLTIVLLSLPLQGGTVNVFSNSLFQPQPRAANKVSIFPANAEAEIGQQLQLKTVITDERGRQTEIKAGFWIALPNELATIDADGKLTFLAAGEVQVVAIVNGKQVRTTIRVKVARAVKIEIDGLNAALAIGESAKLTARVLDAKGNQNKDARLTWASDNPAVASVDAAGQVTAASAGKANITTAAEGASGSLKIEVQKSDVHGLSVSPHPATARTGEVIRFAAEAKDVAGSAAKFANVRWAVSGKGALIERDGRFVAELPGTYEVTALAGDKSATSIITVAPRSVERELEVIGRIPLGAVQAFEIWPFGKHLYVATSKDELRVYDISDPAKPALTETLKVDARAILDVSLTRDGRVGVLTREGASNRQNGLVFLDTTDLAHPKILSSFTETISGAVHNAFIDGRYVYLTDDATGSMRVVDFRDAGNRKQVARWELALPMTKSEGEHAGMTMGGRHLHDVQVKDGLAYLAYWRDGLVILDVGAGIRGGSPEQPKLVSQLRFNHADLYGKGWLAGTREVFRHRNYVFVGDEVIPAEFDPGKSPRRIGRGMLHVIDVSDIVNPRRVAEYVLPEGGAYNVWAEGDWLAMGYYGASGRVLDVSGELIGNLANQGREVVRLRVEQPAESAQNVPFTFGARIFGELIFFNDVQTGIWITKLGGLKLN